MNWRYGPIGLVTVSAVILGAVLALPWFPVPAIDPEKAAQVARGEVIYAQHCAGCHGTNLEGQPDWRARKPDGRMPAPPHDVSGHTWHHTDEQLVQITKKGASGILPGYESDMPGFEAVLSDRDIAAVLAFIKSTWPAEIRAKQATRSDSAR